MAKRAQQAASAAPAQKVIPGLVRGTSRAHKKQQKQHEVHGTADRMDGWIQHKSHLPSENETWIKRD